MMKRIVVCVAAVVMCFGLTSTLMAERPIPAEKASQMAASPEAAATTGPAVRQLEQPVQTASPKNGRAMGTITYDDGVATAAPAIGSLCYGNQFNTWSGNPAMASGSVTAVDFYIATVSGTAAFVSVLGGPGGGTTAPVLTSVNVTGVVSGAWNTVVFGSPLAYTGSSFLAGVWYGGGDVPALGSGSVAGQGFHGMAINDIVGTGFATLPGLNGLVRASGDVLPVELMTFTVQ